MVIWSESARADLRSIHDFIAHGSRHYAKKVAHDIRQKADIPDQLPKAGRRVAELKERLRVLAASDPTAGTLRAGRADHDSSGNSAHGFLPP